MHQHTTNRSVCFTLVLASLTTLALSTSATAYSIDGVSVLPEGTITPESPVTMEVLITTPGTPAFLTQPTNVVVTTNEIFVDLYADSGMLTALDTLTETVALGTFDPGTYVYTVTLHPAVDVGWGTRIVTGSFNVGCFAGFGCQTSSTCLLPPDPGPCDGNCPRFFYNDNVGQCEPFSYGCCEGNANNFLTLAECESACRVPMPAVSEWGLFVTMLLVLTAGTVVIRTRIMIRNVGGTNLTS